MGRAVLLVSPEVLVELCKAGPARACVVVEHALPADASVVRTEEAPGGAHVRVVLESDSFPDDGAAGLGLPELPPPVLRVVEHVRSGAAGGETTDG